MYNTLIFVKPSLSPEGRINLITSAIITLISFIILILLFGVFTGKYSRKKRDKAKIHPEKVKICPLCSSELSPGETIKSVIYPGKPDSRMEIFGCPHCYPASDKNPRRCPVCRKIVNPSGYVIARMFKKPEKTHVHVLGCTSCYKRETFR